MKSKLIFVLISFISFGVGAAENFNPSDSTGTFILKQDIKMPDWESQPKAILAGSASKPFKVNAFCRLYSDGPGVGNKPLIIKSGTPLNVVFETYNSEDSWKLRHDKSGITFELTCAFHKTLPGGKKEYGRLAVDSKTLDMVIGDIFVMDLKKATAEVLD